MKKEFASNICLKCVKKTIGCCSGYPLIPLTLKDMNRISKQGNNPRKFVLVQEYRESWIDGSEKWWANGFIRIKGRPFKLTMRKNKNGSCIFLKKGKGCILGKNRPFVCKIYPFWVNSRGKVVYEACEKKECLMGKSKVPISTAVKMIGEEKRKIKKYRSEIKKDSLTKRKKIRSIILELHK